MSFFITRDNARVDGISRTELIALVRQQADVIAELKADNARLRAENRALHVENQALRAENQDLRQQMEVLHFRVSQMSRRIFGNVSERFVDPQQQVIAGLVPSLSILGDHEAAEGADGDDDDDDPDDDPDGGGGGSTGRSQSARGSRKRRGRLAIPEHIPRVDRVIPPDPHALIGPNGERLVKLREEITEKLDYVAGGFQALRIIRPVYGIPHSDAPTVCAPPPPQVVARGLPTDRTVAMVLCEKFDLHNPLYRQQGRCARAGIDLPRSTLANWIAAATDILEPVIEAITTEVRSASVLAMDDTVIERLAPGTGTTHTARFWGYLAESSCIVRYSDDRSGRHPADFLADWSGAVVADAYSGHEALYRDGSRIHVPCMAHVRRKFREAERDGGDARAIPVLRQFRRLYDLEKAMRGKPPDQIAPIRQRHALPILHGLHHLITELATVSTPRSPLGTACTYYLNLWPRLHRYTDDGQRPIDNNALERLWKPVALGRKNYLFVGNEAGGARAAAAYTITLSCRLADIDPYHYLCDIFAELHAGRRDLAECTPRAWARRQRRLTNVA